MGCKQWLGLGSYPKSEKGSVTFSLTWAQISLTIFGILREVLPGAINNNHNIF